MAATKPVRYEGNVPKSLRTFCDKLGGEKVIEVSRDGGFTTRTGMAYDILLAPGYSADYFGDRMHTLICETVTEAIDCLRTIQPCHADDECRAAWAAKAVR